MNNKDSEFKPYVPADKVMPEFTGTSIILGIILAIVFGGANAYLGLRVGLTVSASIPAAVISMGIIRMIMKKESILENNMVQTVGSAGESVASGAIFTLPAVFMWANEGACEVPGYLTIALVCICGGLLGICLMIPLRNALIVKEHGQVTKDEIGYIIKDVKAKEFHSRKTAVISDGKAFRDELIDFMLDGGYICEVKRNGRSVYILPENNDMQE